MTMLTLGSRTINLLIVALIFAAGYYCAPIFYNPKYLDYIGVLSFFYSSKNLNCIGSFFLRGADSKRDIGGAYWRDIGGI